MSEIRRVTESSYDKPELLKKVYEYKYPNGLDGKKISDTKIFELMKNDGMLPKSWNNPNAITRFRERQRIRNTEDVKIKRDHSFELIDLIRPLIEKITLTEYEKFIIYWKRMEHKKRNEFLDWLALPYLHSGVPINQIASCLYRDFEKIGFLDRFTIRSNLSDKFKPLSKHGKEFIKTEKITEKDLQEERQQ